MKDEALKMALEFIDSVKVHPTQIAARDAIHTAIKQSLAAPVQEPFGYFKAEPFGWIDCAETDDGAIALYEHPAAQRQWVGLSEKDRNDIEDYCEMMIGKPAFDAIEAKLKEKNT
jgi:hypothetical protein